MLETLEFLSYELTYCFQINYFTWEANFAGMQSHTIRNFDVDSIGVKFLISDA